MECIGPVRKMVFQHRWDLHRPWAEMVQEMNEFYQLWKPELVVVDRTGPNGRMIFEGYLSWFGWNLEGWLYTLDSKGELMRNLQLLFESDNLELWLDDSLIRELNSIEEQRLPGTDKPKYPKPDKGESHDDMVQALALACMAASLYLGDTHVDQAIAYDAVSQDHISPFRAPLSPIGGVSEFAKSPVGWEPSEDRTSFWDDGAAGGPPRPSGW
jgi:hypothetical protein